MKIPITHTHDQVQAGLVEGEFDLNDIIEWQRAKEAAGAEYRVTSGGCLGVPIGRRFGFTLFVQEHEKYKAHIAGIDAFIASEPMQYHPPRKEDDGRQVAATVVRLSKSKQDKPVVYAAEEAEEWKRLNGEGPLPAAKARKPGEAVVQKGEVNATTQMAEKTQPASKPA